MGLSRNHPAVQPFAKLYDRVKGFNESESYKFSRFFSFGPEYDKVRITVGDLRRLLEAIDGAEVRPKKQRKAREL